MDEALVRARVAGRTAANELADLFISESVRLTKEFGDYGSEAAIAFFELLRDNLIAIRPLAVETPPQETVEVNPVGRLHEERAIDWEQQDIPDRFVLVEFNEYVRQETEKAVLIGKERWIPKGQMYEIPEVGTYVKEWPITTWMADKLSL